jgi:hypothetical protein
MKIGEPKNRKQLRSFIGVVNHYQDMWLRCSHILAPLASLTSEKVKWEWGPKQSAAFAMAKRVIAREAMLAYPDFSKLFTIHTDASHYRYFPRRKANSILQQKAELRTDSLHHHETRATFNSGNIERIPQHLVRTQD